LFYKDYANKKGGAKPPISYFFPQPHACPFTAPHVAEPQLFPAVQAFPQLEQPTIFAGASTVPELSALTATTPSSRVIPIITATIHIFILTSDF
jgi:hypothetical protein